MSDAARQERTARQRLAAPGSRRDTIMGILRVALPAGVGVLTAFLVMAPLTSAGDVSFVLDKNKVEVAAERLKLQAAQYRGTDAKGQPFTLNTGSAIQPTSAEPIVQLRDLSASLQLEDGPARLVAGRGRYDMDTEKMRVDGPIAFRGPDNYTLDTSDAEVDLQTRRLTATGPATGTVPQGSFSGDRMTADLEGRVVRLEGNARLRIVPGKAK